MDAAGRPMPGSTTATSTACPIGGPRTRDESAPGEVAWLGVVPPSSATRRALRLGGGAGAEQLGGAEQGGQRRTQLVADGGDQLLLCRLHQPVGLGSAQRRLGLAAGTALGRLP